MGDYSGKKNKTNKLIRNLKSVRHYVSAQVPKNAAVGSAIARFYNF